MTIRFVPDQMCAFFTSSDEMWDALSYLGSRYPAKVEGVMPRRSPGFARMAGAPEFNAPGSGRGGQDLRVPPLRSFLRELVRSGSEGVLAVTLYKTLGVVNGRNAGLCYKAWEDEIARRYGVAPAAMFVKCTKNGKATLFCGYALRESKALLDELMAEIRAEGVADGSPAYSASPSA